ncbi:hypothetical protein [Rossellomorea sp. NRS-1567]|uniref:hypothetical protein n=1 Tax=Rossellomorea sp. NRS-1567 TaxID=3233901 RepID=UPI003D2B347F
MEKLNRVEKTEKYAVSDQLKESIIEDIEDGLGWKQIAHRHQVEYNLVQSVGMKERKRIESVENEQGGVIRYWNGHRLNDGKPSPVTTYHISELSRKEQIRIGYLKEEA